MDPAEAIEQSMLSHYQPIDEAMASGDSETQIFYENSTVFVTGGTGFVGKLLIEKLFRACKIKKMYLLIRPKKGIDVQKRLMEIFKSPAFDILHKTKSGFQDCIEIVEGDISLPRLGVSDEDWSRIIEEVTVIFHVGAITKFDEALQKATLINVGGTKEALLLGRECKMLRSFVHVSTAFSHATISRKGDEILEQFYVMTDSPQTVMNLAQSMDKGKMESIASSVMEGWPNSYTFTKALAEDLIRTIGPGMPICIVRPAIVICAYQEPQPGWIDPETINGSSGIFVGLNMGIIHVIPAIPSVRIDFVPADLVTNAIIAAGRETGKRWDDGEKEIKIYTVTNTRNRLTSADCSRIHNNKLRGVISPKAMWYGFYIQATNEVTYTLLSFFFHHLPAFVVDSFGLLLGKQPKLGKLYTKIDTLSRVFKHFMVNEWSFSDKNLQELYNKMSENDKILFNIDISTISNADLIVIWAIGARKYIVKDGLKGTKQAAKKQKIYKMLSFVILFSYILVFLMFIQFVIFAFCSVM